MACQRPETVMNPGELAPPTRSDADGWRPTLFVARQLFLTSRVTGWGLAATAAGVGLILHDALATESVLLIAAVAVMYWLGFAINDFFDATSDARDEYKARHNAFVRNHFDRRTLLVAVIFVLAALLALFASFGLPGLMMYALATAAMWAYSSPPIRIKNRPGGDVLFCSVFGCVFPYVLPLVVMRAPFSTVDAWVLPIGLLSGMAGQLRQQIRDFEVDSLSEVTFTTTIGRGAASRLLRGIIIAISLLLIAAVLTRMIPLTFAPVVAISIPILVDCFLAPARRNMPMELYNVSALIALCYVLILIGVSFQR